MAGKALPQSRQHSDARRKTTLRSLKKARLPGELVIQRVRIIHGFSHGCTTTGPWAAHTEKQQLCQSSRMLGSFRYRDEAFRQIAGRVRIRFETARPVDVQTGSLRGLVRQRCADARRSLPSYLVEANGAL